MGREERLELIREIEKLRGSRVLVYVTGDRRGIETKIGVDTFPFIARHLRGFGNPPKIDLFLYSTGGITMAGYYLVNLIREFTDSFGVLIPFKALSCATLVTLGAEDVIMSKMGHLSPIDPSVSHPLGPSIPAPGPAGVAGLRQSLPVNVEDIFNFIELAREELKITDADSLERVLELMSQKIHPLVLGHSYRLREQIEFLARNLLKYHITDDAKISEIVEHLTRGRYSHSYIFSRREAKEIGLPIVDSSEVESLVEDLYLQYQQMLELGNPYSAEIAIGEQDAAQMDLYRAIIESDNLTHIYQSNRIYRRIQVPIPNTTEIIPQVIEKIIIDGWVENNTI